MCRTIIGQYPKPSLNDARDDLDAPSSLPIGSAGGVGDLLDELLEASSHHETTPSEASGLDVTLADEFERDGPSDAQEARNVLDVQ